METTKKKWYQRWWVIAILIFFGASFIQGIVQGLTEPRQSTNTNNQNVNEEVVETVANTNTPQESAPEPTPIFDLESLHGKNITEIRSVLGSPKGTLIDPTADQLAFGTTEWDNTFEKDGYDLLVTYKVSDGSVIDFFMPAITDDERKSPGLLKVKLGIQNSTDFTAEAVKQMNDPSLYTGMKATPQ